MQDIIAIMGMDELSEEDKRTVSRARKVQRFLSGIDALRSNVTAQDRGGIQMGKDVYKRQA